MPTPVIVGAARTAIGRSFKGALVNTAPETLITTVLPEVVRRSGGISLKPIMKIARSHVLARTTGHGPVVR